jgi:hypothetical protein
MTGLIFVSVSLKNFHSHGDFTGAAEVHENLRPTLDIYGPFRARGDLFSCHTCFDTGPWFLQSYMKEDLVALTASRYW